MSEAPLPRPPLDLSPGECWALAASCPVGRLAWQGRGGPTVVPVNFVVDGHSVRLRTSAYSAIARECDDSPVAFEVDDFDEETHTGWSVLMRGHAHLERGAASGDEADTWAGGTRRLRVRVEVRELTGRRLR